MHPWIFLHRTHDDPRGSVGPEASWGAPDEPDAPENEQQAETPVAQEKVPFYKREITLRRKKTEQHAVEAHDEPDEDGVEVAPKPELGFGSAPVDLEESPVEGPVPGDEEVEEAAKLVAVAADPDWREATVESSVLEEEQSADEPSNAPVAAELETADVADAVEPHDVAEELEAPAGVLELPDTTGTGPSGPDADPDPDDWEYDDVAVGATESGGRKPKRSRERLAMRARRGSSPKARTPGGRTSRGGRKVVGLKLGATQIAAAVVSASEGRYELLQLARTPLESGIVSDGEVRDADALRNALKAFFDEYKLPKRDVRIGLASNRIGVRTLDIVGIDDHARFDNAVRFKAHEVLPVSVHESVLDYRVVDERVTETGEVIRRVLLVVAPRDQVEPYLDVCGGAGLKLAGVDLEALGLLRAFVEPQPFSLRASTDTATVIVAIGHEATTLLVAGSGACEFTRVFDWGGGTLQQTIAQELDVHPAEAATILRGLSLSGPGRTNLDDELRLKALEAVRARLTPFARELVSSLQFYQSQPESLGIGELVVTGGTSGLDGLAEALHQMIGVSVRVGDPLARVVARGGFDPSVESTLGSMAVPIGLAIEDDAIRSVNLLPSELRPGAGKRPNLVAIAVPVAVAVPLTAMALMFMQARSDVTARQAEVDAVQVQIDALPKPTTPTIDPALAGEQAARASALASVLGGRVAWEVVFRDLSRVLPTGVSLTRMSAATPILLDPAVATSASAATAASVPSVPDAVTIEGYTYQYVNVAHLISRLSTVPSLANVQLQSATTEHVAKKTIVKFTVIADLSTPGGVR